MCGGGGGERRDVYRCADKWGGRLAQQAGTLAIMCGGSDEAFTKALPYFELMGANVRHMGPNGAGTAMKLINQLLVGVHTVAAAEAFALANSAGVDIEVASELLSVAWGASAMVDRSATDNRGARF